MLRVVAIDDSKMVLDLLRIGLGRAGFQMTVAMSADAGLAAAPRGEAPHHSP